MCVFSLRHSTIYTIRRNSVFGERTDTHGIVVQYLEFTCVLLNKNFSTYLSRTIRLTNRISSLGSGKITYYN